MIATITPEGITLLMTRGLGLTLRLAHELAFAFVCASLNGAILATLVRAAIYDPVLAEECRALLLGWENRRRGRDTATAATAATAATTIPSSTAPSSPVPSSFAPSSSIPSSSAATSASRRGCGNRDGDE
jgi:hypothetical protein